MPDGGPTNSHEDIRERSLIDYVRPLRKHMLLIALVILTGTILGLVIGLVASRSAPYEAEAVVVYQPTERVTLTGGAQSAPNIEQDSLDLTRQRNTIRVLISSFDVAEMVYRRGQSSNDADVKAFIAPLDAWQLRGAVNIDNRVDLISVKAKAPTPAAATWLANTWAEEAISKINRVYASSATSGVKDALDKARADLDQAEQALQDFLAANPVNALDQERKQTQSFLDAAGSSDIATRLALYDNERSVMRDQVATNLKTVYGLDQRIAEIRALRSRIEQGPDDQDTLYSNQIALISLLNNLISSETAPQLQLDISGADLSKAPRSKASQLQDIDATIAAVQKLQTDIQEQTSTLEGKLGAPLPEVASGEIQAVPAVVREQIEKRNELDAKIEEEQFKQSQLQRTRDLRQSAYDLLRNRVAEQEVNDLISRVVSIGAPANVEETLRTRSILRPILTTLALWTVIAAVLALASAYALAFLKPAFNSNKALRRVIAPRRRTGGAPDRPKEQGAAID